MSSEVTNLINSFNSFTSVIQFNPLVFQSIFQEKSLEDALRIALADSSFSFKECETPTEQTIKSILESQNTLGAVTVDWLSYALVLRYKPITYYYDFSGIPVQITQLKEPNNRVVREELFNTLREKSLKDSSYDMIFMALVVFLSTEECDTLRELTSKAFSALFCLVNKKQTFDTDVCF